MSEARLALGLAGALAAAAALGQRGSRGNRAFDVASIQAGDHHMPYWRYTVRVATYPEGTPIYGPSQVLPRETLAIAHELIERDHWLFAEFPTQGRTDGGTQAQLEAIKIDTPEMRPAIWTAERDEPRGIASIAPLLGLSPWVNSGGTIPEALQRVTNLFGALSASRVTSTMEPHLMRQVQSIGFLEGNAWTSQFIVDYRDGGLRPEFRPTRLFWSRLPASSWVDAGRSFSGPPGPFRLCGRLPASRPREPKSISALDTRG